MLPGYSLHFSEKYLRNLVIHALHVVMYDSITYGDILFHVVRKQNKRENSILDGVRYRDS